MKAKPRYDEAFWCEERWHKVFVPVVMYDVKADEIFIHEASVWLDTVIYRKGTKRPKQVIINGSFSILKGEYVILGFL